MTETGSWVIAVGALVWFREIDPADRAFWASWAAWSCPPLVGAAFVLVFVFERVRFAWVPFTAGVAAVCGGVFITYWPETFRGLPVHAVAVAAILFSWLRLAGDALIPDDGGA